MHEPIHECGASCSHIHPEQEQYAGGYDDGVRERLRLTKPKPKIDRKAVKAKRKQKHR